MPIFINDIDQGSPDWHRLRLGIPTTSNFGKILTGSGKKSSQMKAYADKILADWLAGEPVDQFDTVDMQNGREREASARAGYEFETGLKTQQVGFAYLDENRNVGCSPDALVGDSGLLEIKNRKGKNLVTEYGNGCPTKVIPQIQGQIWVCEREWCDYYSSHPKMIPYLYRVERDEEYIRLLAEAVGEFNIYLNKRKEELKPWKLQ